jgi:RNA polymerase sigma-70 factor, ECF subfamily
MEFESLYGSFSRRLHGWALRRCAIPADADDFVQDTFVAIFCSLPGFRGESAVDAWVFGVARNVWRAQAKARARAKRAAPRIPLDEVDPDLLLDPRTPADALEEGERLSLVERTGRELLGAHDWDRLVDYALERTDLGALEAETGLSRVALKSRISRHRCEVRGAVSLP